MTAAAGPLLDGHRLAMALDDEGYVIGRVICPFDDNPPWDAPCAMVSVTGEPVDGCFVIADFGEAGMECFKGHLDLPTIGVGWYRSGDEITIMPAVTTEPVEASQ